MTQAASSPLVAAMVLSCSDVAIPAAGNDSAARTAAASDASCRACTIIMQPIAHLQTPLQPADSALPHSVALAAHRRYVAATASEIHIFSPDGALAERIDRARAGSADFRSIIDVRAVAGDSLLVVESARARLVVLGPDGAHARSIELPAGAQIRSLRVLQWPHRLLFSGYALRRNDVFLAATDDGYLVITRGLGARRPPRDRRRPYYRLAAGRTALWGAEAHSYVLMKWDTAGRQLLRRTRKPRWFTLSARDRSSMPSSVRGIAEDAAGRLWVYSLVGNERAGPAWRTPEARRAGGRLEAGVEELYDTVVEVLDPSAGRVLARGRIDGYAVGVLENGTVVFFLRSRGRAPGLSVHALALRERAPSSR